MDEHIVELQNQAFDHIIWYAVILPVGILVYLTCRRRGCILSLYNTGTINQVSSDSDHED